MKYLAAYLLAGIGGKTDPSVSDLESILGEWIYLYQLFKLYNTTFLLRICWRRLPKAKCRDNRQDFERKAD